MATWRFSLLALFGVVAAVAVACAALTNPTPLWACVVETGVIATLTYAVLAAVFRREMRRAFWIGVSIIGWGYATCGEAQRTRQFDELGLPQFVCHNPVVPVAPAHDTAGTVVG